MDYTYFSTAPEQSYSGLAGLHPMPAPNDCKPEEDPQFPAQTPTGVFDSNFVPYDTSFPFTPHTPGNQQRQQQPTVPPPLPLPPPTAHATNNQQHQQPAEQYQNQYVFQPSPSDGSSGARTGDVMVEDGTIPEERQMQGRSSSEEKEMANLTPAQSRRKAQNRAAQRAFRERKERRVRDLEEELGQYKQNFSSLLEDHETLKRQLAKVATENEILRATAQVGGANGAGDGGGVKEEMTVGPMKYSPMDYTKLNRTAANINNGNGNGNGSTSSANANGSSNGCTNGESNEKNSQLPISHRIKVSEKTGEKLLDASAAWELIVNYRAEQNLVLDVQDIYERLKGQTQCDGQQPVIEEGRVRRAILDSIAAANDDELL